MDLEEEGDTSCSALKSIGGEEKENMADEALLKNENKLDNSKSEVSSNKKEHAGIEYALYQNKVNLRFLENAELKRAYLENKIHMLKKICKKKY